MKEKYERMESFEKNKNCVATVFLIKKKKKVIHKNRLGPSSPDTY